MRFFGFKARPAAVVDQTREELLAQNILLTETLTRMTATVEYLGPISVAARQFIEVCFALGANGDAVFTINEEDNDMAQAAIHSVIDLATALDGVEPPMHVFQSDRSVH